MWMRVTACVSVPLRLLMTVLHSSLVPRSEASGARELSQLSSSMSISSDGPPVDPDSENDVSDSSMQTQST